MRADSEEALEIRDDIGFYQAVKAGLAKQRGERKSSEFLDRAVRQLVAKAIVPEGKIIDVFSAAGLKKPDIGILSDQFLADVRGLKYKNVAAELLAKLLGDEIKARSKAKPRPKPRVFCRNAGEGAAGPANVEEDSQQVSQPGDRDPRGHR